MCCGNPIVLQLIPIFYQANLKLSEERQSSLFIREKNMSKGVNVQCKHKTEVIVDLRELFLLKSKVEKPRFKVIVFLCEQEA